MKREDKIWFDSPGTVWHEACPLGNGFMGQMIYGGIGEERIDLSHIAFFSGSDTVNPYREDAVTAFSAAREAAKREDYEEVSCRIQQFMGKRGNYGTNLPVGTLRLSFIREREAVSYSRFLDIREGICGVNLRWEKGRQRREAFSSHADGVFAMYLEDTSSVGLCFSVSFGSEGCPYRVYEEEGRLCFDVQALEHVHSDGKEGVCLGGMVRVCTEGGISKTEKGRIFVDGARRAVLYLAMETDYRTNPKELCGHERIDRSVLSGRISGGLEDYGKIKHRHCMDISARMDRQRLVLEGGEAFCGKSGRFLVEGVRRGGDNRRLTELMYQYGRYLLLSSSREDSPLPAPLQGVWNDNVACRIGWTCDMHLDINTQMNYWISEPGRLGESHLPLFEWMEKRLIPHGRETARLCYGLEGWVGELVSNAWGYAAPYWDRSLSPCPTGGIWQASDYMEHYRFSQDRDFLRKHVLPVLEEAVLFFLSYLFEDEKGRLVGGPSISPENSFLSRGKKQYASNGCTYEMLMIRELFLEYKEIGEELREEGLCAPSLLKQVKEALPRLLPYRIRKDAALAEWDHDLEASDPQHRHTSHLLGLFPYSQITPEKTPELAEAAAASVRGKLTPYENWEDTGWARAMLALYSARLHDGKEAGRHLRSMQTVLTGPNLMVMHPPTRGTATRRPVYELDGNTGFSMAVMESLVQSHDGCVRILPALPPEWPNGSLLGAAVRGGIILDIHWKNGHLKEVWAESPKDMQTVFVFGECRKSVQLKAGRQYVNLSF